MQFSKVFDPWRAMPHIPTHELSDLIKIDPEKRSGKPCVRDTRIAVYDVLDYLASGMSESDIIREFPELTAEDIRARLAFAADRERRLVGAA